MSGFRENMLKALELLVKNSVNELTEQGHVASGRGVRSFEVKVIEGGPVLIGQVLGNDYLLFLDTGTRPHYVPIAALLRWARNIKIPLKERVSRAYKVQRSIAKYGTPTPGSFRFSKNGRRVGWTRFARIEAEDNMEDILANSEDDIEKLISELINEIEDVRVF